MGVSESLTERIEAVFARDDEWCGSEDCPRGCATGAKLLKEVRELEETARAYHRLVGALETLGFTRPDEMIQQARDRGWKDPQ
jgi:hypothetical protein